VNDRRWALAAGLVAFLAGLIQFVTAILSLGLDESESTRSGAGTMMWLGLGTLVGAVATATAGARFRVLPAATAALVLVSLMELLFGSVGDATEVYGVETLTALVVLLLLVGRLSRR
jgi:hypothetical protein